LVRPSSKVIVKFLTCMQRHGYIGEFEIIDDHRAGKIVVQLFTIICASGTCPKFESSDTTIWNIWTRWMQIPTENFTYFGK